MKKLKLKKLKGKRRVSRNQRNLLGSGAADVAGMAEIRCEDTIDWSGRREGFSAFWDKASKGCSHRKPLGHLSAKVIIKTKTSFFLEVWRWYS